MPLVPTNPSKLCRQIVGDLIPIMQNQMDNKMESDMKTWLLEESIGIGTFDIKTCMTLIYNPIIILKV